MLDDRVGRYDRPSDVTMSIATMTETEPSSHAAALLYALAEEEQKAAPGTPIPLAKIAASAGLGVDVSLRAIQGLHASGLVSIAAAAMGTVSFARLTAEGRAAASALNVPEPLGPVAELGSGLDDVRHAVLDTVVEWELRVAGSSPSRSHIRTKVRNTVSPKPDIDRVTRAIEALAVTHLQTFGGTEPSYRVTLQGLLASKWGQSAVRVIDETLRQLREWKNEDPSLFRYSWGALRKATGLPVQALNLVYLSISLAKLGNGMFETEGDRWWSAPPDLDVLLEAENGLSYVRTLTRAEHAEAAWTKLAPHRPLGEGDGQYARRPGDGGAELAATVRAGWRRIAVVGPMGVGKSTELAAAQRALQGDRFAFRVNIDAAFDMHRARAGDVFVHVLHRFVEARPSAAVEATLRMADDIVGGDRRDFRRDLAKKALRAAGKVTLLIDGLEKTDESAARAIAEEFFALGDDAEIVLVVPAALAYGPGAALLAEDVHLFAIRPVLVRGEPQDAVVEGRLFLREVALRHLERARVAADDELLTIVDAACTASGGVPRVLLQLLRDAHRHAVVARRSSPSLNDLAQAAMEHGEFLRRSLVPGDLAVMTEAEGHDGSEIPLDRKLRFILQGLVLEYRRADRTEMSVAPTLAHAIRLPKARHA